MKSIFIAIIVMTLFGCSVTRRLERKRFGAEVKHSPKELREEKQTVAPKHYEVKRDSSSLYIADAVKDENGEQIMSLAIEQVVVVAKSRTLPERKGKVMIDFVVTLPRELQGNCQSVAVTPYLFRAGEDVPLQDLTIRGGLFSRVQDRNYWQYERYRSLFNPDSVRSERAYEKFIKYPYPKGVRFDSVVENRNTISYYYTQEVTADDNSKRFLITLRGKVVGLDGSNYLLPKSDTLTYNISSMLSFVDTTSRYLTRIIEKYAVVKDRNFLSFKVNDTRILDTLDDNRTQLDSIEGLMNALVNQYEYHVDSIVLTASSSPEGIYARNNQLAKERAYSLRKYLVGKFGSEVDSLITVRWVAEDWSTLVRLIKPDPQIVNAEAIQEVIELRKDADICEKVIRDKFPADYKYIRENLYPKLRAVNFKYDLRRVGMIKDTIHTTQLDTLYARGVHLLQSRKYAEALYILGDYKDQNGAVALMSLGYDQAAYEVLATLPETAVTSYLKAIVCSRLGRNDEGRASFIKSCNLDERMEYRGNLDPEIAELLKLY